jgi:hypothetical protein
MTFLSRDISSTDILFANQIYKLKNLNTIPYTIHIKIHLDSSLKTHTQTHTHTVDKITVEEMSEDDMTIGKM